MQHHTVSIEGSGLQFRCRDDENVLVGMRYHGADGIQVGCRGGGCGVCKVRVLSGEVEHIGPVSRAHVSEQEQAMGCTLACRATPKTDLELVVMGSFEKPFFKGFACKQNQLSK